MLLVAVKLTLQTILFILFLVMYGLPAIEKLKKQSTIVITTSHHTNGIQAPSITISARNKSTGIGWKEKSPAIMDDENIILHQCRNFSSVEDCLNFETFSWPDFIKDTLLGFETRTSLMNDTKIWSPDFTLTKSGRSFTFHPEIMIGPDYHKDQLIILLDKNFEYDIFVHNKNYFILKDEITGTLPATYIKLVPDSSNNYKFFYLITSTEHKEKNVPEDPCVEDENYNFAVCVKESLARKVGCRPSWDIWSDQTVTNCTKIAEHRLIII